MSRTKIYLVLAAIGFAATWYYNIQYFAFGGSIMPKPFFQAAFANVLATAITIDVYWSALVFSIFVYFEHKSGRGPAPWRYIAVTFLIGLAVGLPLYLARREKSISIATSAI